MIEPCGIATRCVAQSHRQRRVGHERSDRLGEVKAVAIFAVHREAPSRETTSITIDNSSTEKSTAPSLNEIKYVVNAAPPPR